MCKFFSVVGLSLALLGGCGADSGAAQPTEAQTQQSISVPAAGTQSATPADNSVSSQEATASEAALDAVADRRICRGDRGDRECDYRCRDRGCRYGYCDRDYNDDDYGRRCICRRCYRGE